MTGIIDATGRKLRPLELLGIAVAAGLLMELTLHFRPANYLGGSSDEQRYLETALSWVNHGPSAGKTHWALRHPLILSIVASFRTFGVSMEALQLVCRVYADLLAGMTTAMLARHAGPRTALLWLVLAIMMPVLHQNATNCGPELIELFFAAASGWAFWEARSGGRFSPLLFAVSGAMLGLAVMTREISACLIPVYGWAWLKGQAPRRGIGWFAAGFLPPLLIDNLWLWAMTGKVFYRLHIDESHTHIYSAHLHGGIYDGSVFLNPVLASRWIPPGPVKLHWTIDPILNLFAAPDYGLVFAAWALLALARPTRPAAGSAIARVQPWLLGAAVACYVLATWLLTLRPQPRYYLIAVYAGTIAVALLATRPSADQAARRIKTAAIGLMLFECLVVILLLPDRQRDARLILPWLAQHPQVLAHMNLEDSRRIAFPAILAGRKQQITSAPTPIGGLEIREQTKPQSAGVWKRRAVLQGNRLFPYVNGPRTLIVEQRVR